MTRKSTLTVVPDEQAATPTPDAPALPALPAVTPLGFEDGLARVMLIVVPDAAGVAHIAYKLWNTDEYRAMNIVADAVPLMRLAEQAFLARIAQQGEAAAAD